MNQFDLNESIQLNGNRNCSNSIKTNNSNETHFVNQGRFVRNGVKYIIDDNSFRHCNYNRRDCIDDNNY